MSLTRADITYRLPEELIAQEPAPERSASRLMVVRRSDGTIRHAVFRDLPEFLSEGDLLVLNDTRVVPARLRGSRTDTGSPVEILLLENLGGARWRAMIKPSRRIRSGATMDLSGGLHAAVTEKSAPGRAVIELSAESGDLEGTIRAAGETPLPPYIRRPARPSDTDRYQTVYASRPGAVAAPTAGLHFDESLFVELACRGIGTAMLTLHVGPGTFEPLRCDDLEMNTLEPERYEIGPECCRLLERTRSSGGRVIAVGTTTTRVLEALGTGEAQPSAGTTSLFIRPPFEFRRVDALVTNFHLPGSSLLCLVAAFMGLDLMHEAYGTAVAERYRFYSYGDAMLIL
ncbi:tRNA preQ1(34) S-adenosylmethionine ribosyltransferase-isomerase QueA [Candidatus Fermentibacteria bacterium]|nr:tRNA preQ1(34) S-adenosylmethionine ribosyltransferase-isomerase QueA [Candidatus Fermentibacteria bacterium]